MIALLGDTDSHSFQLFGFAFAVLLSLDLSSLSLRLCYRSFLYMSMSLNNPIQLDDESDEDFVSLASPMRLAINADPQAAFRSYVLGFISSTIEAETRNWSDLRDDYDVKEGDRWYHWWGKREWKKWLDGILLRVTAADPGLHGCVIYSTQGCTSFRYQTGYGKWMYRQDKCDLPRNWDSTNVPLPDGTQSEQVHRLLAYLCTDNEELRYAIGHPKKPVRNEPERKDQSPLILVHLCNNGDSGCVNPQHVLFSDALENASRNGCKHGSRSLCPHSPKCIFVDKKTGAIIPWRNVDHDAVMDYTQAQLLSLTFAQWLSDHRYCRLLEETARAVLPPTSKKQKRYRNSQSDYMKSYRAKKSKTDAAEEKES